MFRMGKGMVQVTVSPEPKGSLLILGEGVGLDAVNKSKASPQPSSCCSQALPQATPFTPKQQTDWVQVKRGKITLSKGTPRCSGPAHGA